MKKMVIGGTYVYSGKGFSYAVVKKIRDGGIVELGYSSWEGTHQWIEVLEDNFFIGFISSKTKLIDLDNYFYVMENNLYCYEKPDSSSEIKVCLKRSDKIYLISKIFNKGRWWLKIYDKHGFRCYIDANSSICPSKFAPYSTTLGENTFMYIASPRKGVFKTIYLKKGDRIYVKGLVFCNFPTSVNISSNSQFSNINSKIIYYNPNSNCHFTENKIKYLSESDSSNNTASFDNIWMEIYARGLSGYIPAITKTNDMPYIKQLPYEPFKPSNNFCVYSHQSKLSLAALISIVLGLIFFFLFYNFSIFAFYLWTLGICIFILKHFCS